MMREGRSESNFPRKLRSTVVANSIDENLKKPRALCIGTRLFSFSVTQTDSGPRETLSNVSVSQQMRLRLS